MTDEDRSKILIIGLSGPSSSGKTTLARLLRGVFNIEASPKTNGVSIRLFILHEDDFYKTDKDIPQRSVSSATHGTRTVQDWDCVESLNLALLSHTITHVKQHGTPPADMRSIEDQNSVGAVGVSPAEVAALSASVTTWLGGLPPPPPPPSSSSPTTALTVCILDGFLLFPPPPPALSASVDIPAASHPLLRTLHDTLAATLTHKIFLPATKAQTLDRRARRAGYVTIEGFWADPPGYVEDVVWANFARDHAWMFRAPEDVDAGRVERDGHWVREENIVVGPGEGAVSMKEVLDWGVEVLKDWVAAACTTGV